MKSLWLFFLMAGWPLMVAAQNTIGLPQIINYTKNDYKAGTQTWDIRQDSRGIMYFANNEGLLTYDGSHWNAYPLPNKTIVRALAIDDNDRIYAGGQGEIGYFSPGPNGNLVYTSLQNQVPAAQNKFADIWRIEIYKASVFFMASDRLLEYRNNSIKVYPNDWQYLKKAGNKLYAQDKRNGLLVFNGREWQPVSTGEKMNNVLVSGIVEAGADSLLVNTQLNGIYLLRHDSIIKKLPPFTGSNVNMSARINATELVAGTTADGCVVLDFNGRMVQQLSRTEGLQNNDVLSVFLDRNKNLWAGLNNGISFIAYNAPIKYITPNKSNELPGYSTRIFNKELYIATSDGAYDVPLPGTAGDLSFSKGDFTRVKNSKGEIWRLDEVNNHILIGQHAGSGILRDHSSEPLFDGDGAWLFKPFSSVFPSQDILAGTYTGVRMLEYNAGAFTDKGKLAGGPEESLRFLEIDNNNVIWASHPYRGVYRLQLSPDHKSISYRLFTDSAGLPSALSNYVFKVRNRVVFCTGKGVYEFDDAAGRFVPSAFLAPVFGHMEIRYLNEDGDGNIWFCSGKTVGVANFNQPSGGKPFTITWIPELTGKILLGFENIYPFNKENIFIGSEKGVIHLNYDKYTTKKQLVQVLLGQVKAFGKSDSILFGGYFHRRGTSGYEQDAQEIISLPRSYNSFHFEYSSPAYGLQNNIEYSFQLEGYDNRWSAWSSRPEKDYTNLPGGKYIFKVKARDNLGHESGTVTYSFIVKPAWYKTIWAYLLYALLFVAMLYLLNEWQERNLRIQQRRFDEEQQRLKYIHQLELEKNEKEIIKLQNEKLAMEIHSKNNALADASMHLVERGDALVKLKDILAAVYKKGNSPELKNALLLLNDVEKNNDNWEQFSAHFNEINNDFLKKLKSRFPALTNTDLKVCAYLQLKLSTKEIAQLMAISVRGVEIKRYRLRKKLNLPTEQSMTDFLNGI
jgi:hypothetical protein